MIYIFCVVVVIAVTHAAFRHSDNEHEKTWQELQQTIVVDNLISWSAIRAGTRKAVTAREAEVAAMTDRQFKATVMYNLYEIDLREEAEYVATKKEGTPLLSEWEVRYKSKD